MATKKISEEIKEETTPKKTTTRKKSTTTKKTTTTKSKKEEMTIADIPQDLLAQLTAQITNQVMSSLNVSKEEDKIEEKTISKSTPNKYDLTYFYSHPELCKERVKVTAVSPSVTYVSSVNNNYVWRWKGEGSPQYLTIEEIIAMENANQRFLHTPWLRVHDDRLVQAFKLEKLYEALDKTEDLNLFFSLGEEEIKELLERLPRLYVNNLCSKIQKGISNGSVKADYRIIKLIEKITKIIISL